MTNLQKLARAFDEMTSFAEFEEEDSAPAGIRPPNEMMEEMPSTVRSPSMETPELSMLAQHIMMGCKAATLKASVRGDVFLDTPEGQQVKFLMRRVVTDLNRYVGSEKTASLKDRLIKKLALDMLDMSGGFQRIDPIIQQQLNKILGINIKVDGMLGPKTKDALTYYKNLRHFPDSTSSEMLQRAVLDEFRTGNPSHGTENVIETGKPGMALSPMALNKSDLPQVVNTDPNVHETYVPSTKPGI